MSTATYFQDQLPLTHPEAIKLLNNSRNLYFQHSKLLKWFLSIGSPTMDVCSHEGRQLDGLFVLTDITSFDQPTLSSAIVVVFKRYKYLNTASLEICHIKESDKQLLFSALHQSPSAKHDFFIFVPFKVWQPSKPPLLSICEKSNTKTLLDKV